MAFYLTSNNSTEQAKSQLWHGSLLNKQNRNCGWYGRTGAVMIPFTTYCYAFNVITEDSHSEAKTNDGMRTAHYARYNWYQSEILLLCFKHQSTLDQKQ
jgi:hypothetical protein